MILPELIRCCRAGDCEAADMLIKEHGMDAVGAAVDAAKHMPLWIIIETCNVDMAEWYIKKFGCSWVASRDDHRITSGLLGLAFVHDSIRAEDRARMFKWIVRGADPRALVSAMKSLLGRIEPGFVVEKCVFTGIGMLIEHSTSTDFGEAVEGLPISVSRGLLRNTNWPQCVRYSRFMRDLAATI